LLVGQSDKGHCLFNRQLGQSKGVYFMKKSNVFLGALLTVSLTIGLVLAGCGGGKKVDEFDFPFQLTADGSYEYSTTKLNFSFYEPVTGFSADKITLSGMTGVTKGTLSGSGQEYTLPISGFKETGHLDVKVEIKGIEYHAGVYIYYVVPKDGIYIGIIKFAGNAESINLGGNNYYYDYRYDYRAAGSEKGGDSGPISVPGGGNPNGETNSDAPVLLDQSMRSQINNIIYQQYQKASQAGTAIYYAVHKALANLTSSQSRFPDNTDSVYIITFTDGLDNGSGGQSRASPIENKSFEDTPSYVTYVKDQIATRKIKGKEITAYSIGVKGNDVQDPTGFTTSLQNIASPGKSKELNDYSSIESTFNEIAEGLIQGSNFTMTTTLLPSNTKVRMTFDIDTNNPTPAEAEASTKYIEGTVIRSGTNYTFTNIAYAGGIFSDVAAGGTIAGTVSGTTVNFLFRNIIGYNSATDSYKTKQWTWNSNTSSWQINSEYTTGKSDFGNTIIYLVLDCSTSMDYSDMGTIRSAVSSFIEKIYQARYGY
jgi:hypothetical protein